jgi:hypothetical protein
LLCASSIACHIACGEAGISRLSTPTSRSASSSALMMAGGMPIGCDQIIDIAATAGKEAQISRVVDAGADIRVCRGFDSRGDPRIRRLQVVIGLVHPGLRDLRGRAPHPSLYISTSIRQIRIS